MESSHRTSSCGCPSPRTPRRSSTSSCATATTSGRTSRGGRRPTSRSAASATRSRRRSARPSWASGSSSASGRATAAAAGRADLARRHLARRAPERLPRLRDRHRARRPRLRDPGGQLAVHVAFDDLGLHRVQAAVVPENTASARVLQKVRLPRGGPGPPLPVPRRAVEGPPHVRPDGATTARHVTPRLTRRVVAHRPATIARDDRAAPTAPGRSPSSTAASAASPCCTSASCRCRTRTSSTSATPRASRTATARPSSCARSRSRSPTTWSRTAPRRSSSRATRPPRRRSPTSRDAYGRHLPVVTVVRPESRLAAAVTTQRPGRPARHAAPRSRAAPTSARSRETAPEAELHAGRLPRAHAADPGGPRDRRARRRAGRRVLRAAQAPRASTP